MKNDKDKIAHVEKRNGEIVTYDIQKITDAITKAYVSCELDPVSYQDEIEKVVNSADDKLRIKNSLKVNIETIQNVVEMELMGVNPTVAKEYILYRAERAYRRNITSEILNDVENFTTLKSDNFDNMRENANINSDSPMGWMLKVGTSTSKSYWNTRVIPKEYVTAHTEGFIHIHDLDFYSKALNCIHVDMGRLFSTRLSDDQIEDKFQQLRDKYKDQLNDPVFRDLANEKISRQMDSYIDHNSGFNTGHGNIRPPKSFRTAASLICIVLQSTQNDMFGGQSAPNIDFVMERFIGLSFISHFKHNLTIMLAMEYNSIYSSKSDMDIFVEELFDKLNINDIKLPLSNSNIIFETVAKSLLNNDNGFNFDTDAFNESFAVVIKSTCDDTEKEVQQGCESIIYNLCSMHSRCGNQVPFSSINYGMCTSSEGRLFIHYILTATERGLGNGETSIFPIQVFLCKDGVNTKKGDPNYDLFRHALSCTGKRLFPNYLFLDAPFNKQYYIANDPRTFIQTMGCRTRVISNVNGEETSIGRGNLSFTTLNLSRIALASKEEFEKQNDSDDNQNKLFDIFKEKMSKYLKVSSDQLYHRYKLQCQNKVYNFPMVMGQGIWFDSDKLKWDDTIESVLKHGSLSIGYVGLAEALVILVGSHHGQTKEAQDKGKYIIKMIRDYCDELTKSTGLNYSCIATPAEGYAGAALRKDRKDYGIIKGVTDKDYYTNSNHIPVGFDISIKDKIDIEAPYHELTNAGHICYVELDGDMSKNVNAMESIVLYMKERGIGYGSINVPVDRHDECGYNGIINLECPLCGETFDEFYDSRVTRIRRITGYLSSTLNRWNDAKQAEEKDRVKHTLT
jgi:ribonucleoside-triphosphate reductase